VINRQPWQQLQIRKLVVVAVVDELVFGNSLFYRENTGKFILVRWFGGSLLANWP